MASAWDDIPELYDVAREVNHNAGLAWTDPRTGVTYQPSDQQIRAAEARQRRYINAAKLKRLQTRSGGVKGRRK